MSKSITLGLSSTLAVALCALAYSAVAHATSQAPGQVRSVPAPSASPDAVRIGSQTVVVGENVWVEQSTSLLPPVVLQNGTSVRSVRVNALYMTAQMRLVGQTLYHQLVPVDSSESLDLSIDDLEVNEANAEAQLRSCTVRVTPVAGKTWGTVDSVKTDVVMTAQLKTH
jgi:hypothetical protein